MTDIEKMRLFDLTKIIFAGVQAMQPHELVEKLTEINEQLSDVVNYLNNTLASECAQAINESSSYEDVVNCFTGINTNCVLLSCGKFSPLTKYLT